MKLKKVINLFGGPGAGKSTTAAGVFTLLKLHGVNCELVTEFAKDLTWEERYKTLGNQYYICAKQHHRIWRLQEHVDVIITDSPLLQSLAYTEDNNIIRTVVDMCRPYNNSNYFIERVKPYQEAGRSQTEDEAKDVCKNIIGILDRTNASFITVKGNTNGINEIAERTLSDLGKEFKFMTDNIPCSVGRKVLLED